MSEEASAAVTTDAGADTQTQTAEAAGNQDTATTGADTQTATAEEQGTEGAQSTESGTQDGTEGKDRGSHQKTLEERALEIAEKKAAEIVEKRLAEAETERQTQAKPNFSSEADEVAVANNIFNGKVRLSEILEEIRLVGTDSPEAIPLKSEYARTSKWIGEAEEALNLNIKLRTEWESKQQLSQKQQAIVKEIQDDINRTVLEVGKAQGLTAETLQAGRKFMDAEFQRDPTLQKRYNDIITHRAHYQGFSGVQAAVDWAISYAKENMGKAAAAARDQKEAGKEKVIGSGAETVSGDFANVHSFNDLLKLPSVKINQFAKEHPKRYQELKNRHFKS